MIYLVNGCQIITGGDRGGRVWSVLILLVVDVADLLWGRKQEVIEWFVVGCASRGEDRSSWL